MALLSFNCMTRVTALAAACLAAACSSIPTSLSTPSHTSPASLGADAAVACAALKSLAIPTSAIALPVGAITMESATFKAATAASVAPGGPTPAARITPALPAHCQLIGAMAAVKAGSPAIRFQINLPAQWNGRSVQYGGGGFNGVLINALSIVPAHPFDTPSPLAQGYVTYGTDSGHQNKPNEPVQTFALDDEALINFAHASYKKVRDVAVAVMQRAYGHAPSKLYFVGSSEGGREGLLVAQRYPQDFDGVFSRVPVIHWTGLQHVGLRDGMATMNGGWMRPAQVKLVHDAVLAACDAADGLADGIVANPVGCRKLFDVSKLRCAAGQSGDACLTDAQVKAVQTTQQPYRFDFALANGLREYPGRGPSGENTLAYGPTGGWNSWWLGAEPPTLPPSPKNGIVWVYGAGAIQYFYARDPKFDLRNYKPADHRKRIEEVSALMDTTNPDLSAFHARGGKLILLENLADYAQSPYAGIQYFESVQQGMGAARVREFARLYTAPNVDHVGSGAPASSNFFAALTHWVEKGVAPGAMQLVEQEIALPARVIRSRPLCEWPQFPRYKGGDVNAAASFECVN